MSFPEHNPFIRGASSSAQVSQSEVVKQVLGRGGLQALRRVNGGRAVRSSPQDHPETLSREGYERTLQALTAKEDQELLDSIYERERTKVYQFFREKIEVPPLPVEATPDRIHLWREMKFEMHFLPKKKMEQGKIFSGWRMEPSERFYNAQTMDDLAENAHELTGKWLLIDMRDKPPPATIPETYQDDILAPAIKAFHDRSHQGRLGSQRGSISAKDLSNPELMAEFAERLNVNNLPHARLRLPRAIEYNYLTNAYYPQWAEPGMEEWMMEQDGYKRGCYGGIRSESGLTQNFGFLENHARRQNIGFRLVVEFSP